MTHSAPLMPPMPCWMAMAAPESPAMRLWLSLVGIPKTETPTLYPTMESRAAQRAISAFWVLSPKSTILLMVEATELLIWVMINTPRKLKTALMMMAFLALKHRVVTQVAMALGASVHPFTKITPSVNSVVTRSAGFSRSSPRKPVNDRSIRFIPFLFYPGKRHSRPPASRDPQGAFPPRPSLPCDFLHFLFGFLSRGPGPQTALHRPVSGR